MQAPERRQKPWIAAALALCIAAAPVLWNDMQRLDRQTQQLRVERAKSNALQSETDRARRAARQAEGGDAAQAQTAIDVLKRVEASWGADISLQRMDTDLAKKRMRLQIQATSKEALFGFVERLQQHFGDGVFLERHTGRDKATDQWTLDANLTIGWQ
ncbi:MAG: hypothetical protein JWP38_731 [Herbaspirillum sp.]|nr:hypothetical protein [Herbaspirillum sp.]